MRLLVTILAAGQARRMGGINKAQQLYKGTSLIDTITAIIHPQHKAIAINIRSDDAHRYAYPTFHDELEGFLGPLAGIHSALSYAKKRHYSHVLSLACDCPYYPHNLIKKFIPDDHSHIIMASSFKRTHPVISLWPVTHEENLKNFIIQGGRKIDAFIMQHPHNIIDFTPNNPQDIDPFTNINYSNQL